jgi:hypothetical protein
MIRFQKHSAIFFSFILFTVLNCNSVEPPPDNAGINLSLEDASSIEAWITLKTTNLQLPTTVTLKQSATGGDQTRETINLISPETLLYVDSLLPNTTYNFQATSIQSAAGVQVSSNKLQVTTMDTTSHNFTWQSWTFGEHSSSRLYDVAIIDENNIWAVGEIYMNDSLGQADPHAYNAVHWDGNDWILFRIMFYTICGQTSRTPYPAKAIFAFNGNDIWIGGGGRQLVKISGTTQTETVCAPFSIIINKIWGTSSNDLYVVGNTGNMAHYNGTSWQKIESGTDVDIQDIWGVDEDSFGEPLILCAASYVAQTGEKKILRITNVTRVDTIFWGTGRRVHSLWFNSSNKLFASGGGVFIRNYNDHWVEQTELPLYFTERVRGKDINDLFVVGHFGLIAHYNGSSWKTYPEASTALVYTSLDYKNNLMVTVGYTQNQAVVQFMIKN